MTSQRREPLFEPGVRDDEAAIERPARRGRQARAVRRGDRRAARIGSLAVCVAGRRAVPVAYVPGWRCGAPRSSTWAAETDRRARFVLADTVRTHARRLDWLEVGDETLERLRVLGGCNPAHDATRATNRLRDMLLRRQPGAGAGSRAEARPPGRPSAAPPLFDADGAARYRTAPAYVAR
jgi:hypothetical protein